MDLKVLISVFARPWMIEGSAAEYYAGILFNLISGNHVNHETRSFESDQNFRVNASGQRDSSGSVMVIPISGPMMKNDFCGSIGTATMARMIQDAQNDNSITGILLSISSPGGSVEGTEHLASVIAASRKPVVAHGDMMASAAYWVASQATEIHLNGKTSMAGSIGTMAVIRDMRAFQESRGVKEVVMFASRSVDKNRAALDAMDNKPEAYQREYLDPINDVFESTILKGRSGKIDYAKEDVGTGKIYMGTTALKAGLADRISTFETAVKRVMQLSKKSNTKSNMATAQDVPVVAFERTMQAAQADEFPVIDGGFMLGENDLNNIESVITSRDARIQELESQVAQFEANTNQATEANGAAVQALAAANDQVAALTARIQELEALNITGIEDTATSADDRIPGQQGKAISSITAQANELRIMQGKPAII